MDDYNIHLGATGLIHKIQVHQSDFLWTCQNICILYFYEIAGKDKFQKASLNNILGSNTSHNL